MFLHLKINRFSSKPKTLIHSYYPPRSQAVKTIPPSIIQAKRENRTDLSLLLKHVVKFHRRKPYTLYRVLQLQLKTNVKSVCLISFFQFTFCFVFFFASDFV